MAGPVRVLLVGGARFIAAMRDDLEAAGLHVIGDVEHLPAAHGVPAPDVVVLDGTRGMPDAADAWQDGSMPALVVIGDGIRPSDVAAVGAPGWAIVGTASTAAEVSAAIVAAAHGFAVQPASETTTEDEDEDEEEQAPMEALTARERDVLELVAQGLPNRTIASRLAISEHTVKFHLSSIFGKLGVATRTEAVRRGVRAGLISL